MRVWNLLKEEARETKLEKEGYEETKDKDYTVGMKFKDSIERTWNALYY